MSRNTFRLNTGRMKLPLLFGLALRLRNSPRLAAVVNGANAVAGRVGSAYGKLRAMAGTAVPTRPRQTQLISTDTDSTNALEGYFDSARRRERNLAAERQSDG